MFRQRRRRLAKEELEAKLEKEYREQQQQLHGISIEPSKFEKQWYP